MVKEALKKLVDYGMLIIAMVLALLYMKQCQDNATLEENLKVEIDNVRQYESLKGEIIDYNDAMDTRFKDLELYNEELKQEIKNMRIKNPEVVIRTTTELRIDTIYVPFTDTLPCDDFVKKIDIDSTWYDINMTLKKESLMIDSMKFPNESIVTVGEKKNGIFKKNEYVVAVKNTNPYIETDTLETYTFKKDKKFFERPSVWAVISAVGTFTLVKLIEK